MIAEALILPTERPPRLRDVKRALLTYRRVQLFSPNDRELIPPNTFATVAGGLPPVIGFGGSAVRPLGKVPRYDQAFETLVLKCSSLLDEGILTIRDTPRYETRLTIGGTPIPPGVPNPRLTYQAFRCLVSQPEIVGNASAGVPPLSPGDLSEINQLAPPGQDDGQLRTYAQGKPLESAFPERAAYPGYLTSEELRPPLTLLCHARIGSLVRSLLTADSEGLTPLTSDAGLAAIMQRLDRNVGSVLAELTEGEEEKQASAWIRRLEHIVFTEFIDPRALDALTIQQILQYRTTAWESWASAQHALKTTLRDIARESTSSEEFGDRCRREIESYRKVRTDLDNERAELGFRSATDIGLILAAAEAGLVEKLFALGAPEPTIVIGAVCYVLKLAKENVPHWRELLRREKELGSSAGYALFRNYERVG